MDSRPDLTLEEQFAAAIDWWREAGVDHDYDETPHEWLAEKPGETKRDGPPPSPQPRIEPPAPEPQRKLGGERSDWPDTLDAFRQWWLAEPSLDDAPLSARVAPRGAANAELMVLVPMPEAGDGEHLLAGEQGRLVANMLRAMKIAEDETYIASALPRHMPAADWPRLQAEGMGEVLLHHLALASPKRLLVLGRDVLPLLGLASSKKPLEVSGLGQSIHALASFSPEHLLQRAKYRADLWRRWLDWTQD